MKDIDDIRRDNLRLLEEAVGGLAAAAEVVGMSPSQFANLRDGAKDSKTGKPRGMHKSTARRIEAAAGRPEGWLDTDHSAPARSGDSGRPIHEEIHATTLVTAYQRADVGTKAVVDALLVSGQTAPAWLEPMMALALLGMKQAASQWMEEHKSKGANQKTGT